VALMYAGRIIADASPAQMKNTLQQEAGQLLDIATDRPLMALKILEEDGFAGVALFGKRIHLLAKDPQQASQQIESRLTQQGISLLDIAPRIPSLEDVFVYRVMAREKEARSQ